jgi:hypothetical protein
VIAAYANIVAAPVTAWGREGGREEGRRERAWEGRRERVVVAGGVGVGGGGGVMVLDFRPGVVCV